MHCWSPKHEHEAMTAADQSRRSWWVAFFTLTSVDTVSAAIYGGVLLAHVPSFVGADSTWSVVLSVTLIVLLFAMDRSEALWYPQGNAPTRLAIALLAVRIVIMAAVVQLDASTLGWFLFLIPPFRACLYFGTGVSYVIATITWVGFVLTHTNQAVGQAEQQQEIILFAMALLFVCTIARALRGERLSREHTEALLSELERSHAQLQAHAETVAELATTEERNRLARDIHDSLGHYLTVTNVQIAKAIAFQYRDPAVAEQAMRNAKDTAHQALDAVRQSVGALRTTRDAFAFVDALQALVERTRTDGCEITLHTEGSDSGFTPAVLTTLYYVAQEGLTNIQKHAHAANVTIDISFSESQARLTVGDDGRGFRIASVDERGAGVEVGYVGYGLQSMRERVARVSGRLLIASQPGDGTTLTVFVPRVPGVTPGSSGNGVDREVKA
jgi:signal transduction histidine kinase